MSRHTFWFDASACSGCKACHVACKDRNDLPPGVLWRRVYEVSGGGWTRRDGAWLHDVLAYNLSMACNHCERPICMEVCPAGAISQRADGLVLLDPERCMGCRYCGWACPYGAPQYDDVRGRMGKCTFCVEDVDRGGAPACVAACPERALDFGSSEELEARHGPDAAVHPLPDPSLTRPALSVRPHAHGERAAAEGARVANREEVRIDARDPVASERSLVAFTLLVQGAVGMFFALLVGGWLPSGAWTTVPGVLLALAPGALAMAAGVISLLHLGSPSNAWRALTGVGSSWLSREILFLLAFLAGWGAWSVLGSAYGSAGPSVGAPRTLLLGVVAGMTALAGVGLLHAMSRVYRLRTVPAWDTGLTPVAFFLSAGSLGGLAAALGGLLVSSQVDAARLVAALAAVCMAAELLGESAWRAHRLRARAAVVEGLASPEVAPTRAPFARSWLLLGALLLTVGFVVFGGDDPAAVTALVVAMGAAASGETLGRVAFYRSYARRGL